MKEAHNRLIGIRVKGRGSGVKGEDTHWSKASVSLLLPHWVASLPANFGRRLSFSSHKSCRPVLNHL